MGVVMRATLLILLAVAGSCYSRPDTVGQPCERANRIPGNHPDTRTVYVADHRIACRSEPDSDTGVEDLVGGGVVAVGEDEGARALESWRLGWHRRAAVRRSGGQAVVQHRAWARDWYAQSRTVP